jgi:hypothetical protein
MKEQLVSIKDGGLIIDGMPVHDLHWKEGDKLPTWFVIRVHNGKYWSFVCGLDLAHDKGLYWLGANTWKVGNECFNVPPAYYDDFSTIKRILDKFVEDTQGKDWAIYEEEPRIYHEPDFYDIDYDY